jgi:N4-gp56 family major capsid protein
MAGANYTGTGQVTWDQNAYEILAYMALRPQLYVDAFADVKPTNQSMPGSAVIFNITSDLSVASTTINESNDVTPVQVGDSQVTVTLAEYGNAVVTTAKLRGTSYLPVDPVVANVIGFNAGLSLDTIARQTLQNGSNVRYGAPGQANTAVSRATVIPTNTLAAAGIRRAYTDLLAANVAMIGGYYVCYAHPHTTYDLRAETGAAAWRDPHTYSQPAEIWNGEVGEFEGFRFVVSSQAPLFADSGSSTTLTDVYGVLCFGRQAMAKAWSITDGNGPMPQIILGPVTDTLRRFVPIGWYWLGGYARFREAAIRRIEVASSVGTN